MLKKAAKISIPSKQVVTSVTITGVPFGSKTNQTRDFYSKLLGAVQY
jgi:hypothetical protein